MTPFRPLLRPIRALILGLTILCLLAQPVIAAAHELHDAGHESSTAVTQGPHEPSKSEVPPPGILEGLLHAFDCCLHATALPAAAFAWAPHRLQSLPPRVRLPVHTPSPTSRFLRPPISA